VLTDVDEDACENARYNVEKQQKVYFPGGFVTDTRVQVLDWEDDDLFVDEHGEASFDIILGADVVHQEDMASGVVRALDRHLAPHGFAFIVNPAPHSRGGCGTFRKLLRERGWKVETRAITSPIIIVGMEDECEDVPLDFYVIQKSEDATPFPPLNNLA
jgi:hypothetical protein